MRKTLLFIAILFSTILSTTAFAAALNLYENPDASSKVVATMQSGDQLIPIFYSDKKDWVKVANPKNGNVGWVKISELQGPVVITKINGSTIQQQIILDKTKPMSYNMIQYSGPNELKPEDAEKIAKDMEKYNEKVRASMQKMQEMFKEFDKTFYTFPVLQPVIIVPFSNNGGKSSK